MSELAFEDGDDDDENFTERKLPEHACRWDLLSLFWSEKVYRLLHMEEWQLYNLGVQGTVVFTIQPQ